MRLLAVRRRLLLLGVVGVLMTLAVAGVAELSLSAVSAINRELAQVSRAQRFHQDADEMHDALRADVARAQLAGSGTPGFSRAQVRRETERHAADFRADLQALEALVLPQHLERAFAELRPAQETYIMVAESLVESALAPGGTDFQAQAAYEAAFQQLAPVQARVTDRLVATSTRVERLAAEEKREADRFIATATLGALGGWIALVAWHLRSIRRLHGALVREARQRSHLEVLQRSLLPTHLPEVPGLRLAARSVPGSATQRVGGDWYDVIPLPNGQVCIVVGDVVGHDLAAASGMGQLRNALRAYAFEDSSPSSVLTRVNRAAHHMAVSDLATTVYAVLDPDTCTLTWASAGHMPPLLSSDPDGGRLLNGEPGPPLGVSAQAEYVQHQERLHRGDNVLLYSDGLVERRGTSIDARLTALQKIPMPPASPDALCEHVLAAMLGADATAEDDVTVLVLQVAPKPAVTAAAQPPAPAGRA